MKRLLRSVRARLLLVALLVEAVMLTVLVSNSLRLMHTFMTAQLEAHANQITPILSAALVAPLAQSDYATVQSVLDESRKGSSQGLRYLVVTNLQGSRLAQSGIAPDALLPTTDANLAGVGDSADGIYNVQKPIAMFGQPLGTLHFGLDLSTIFMARNTLLTQGVLIALAELLLSFLVLTGIVWWMTRHLKDLTLASQQVASGNLTPTQVPEGADELGKLGAAFNAMSRAIAERVTELEAARHAAEQANRTKSRFLATMSHEIRTPMNGILGMAELLKEPNLSEHDRLDYAQTVLSSGRLLLNLLNDILDMSKIEANKLQLDVRQFDPAQLLHETQLLFAAVAQQKNLQLSHRWQGDPAACYLGDVHRLQQMLNNLVGNAIKFTQEGQIDIEARELTASDDTVQLEISVKDTGMGLTPEQQARIFKPFVQADSSTTRDFGGSGLGLAIVSRLAHMMNGQVGVDSTPGLGSRFWLRVRVQRVRAADIGVHCANTPALPALPDATGSAPSIAPQTTATTTHLPSAAPPAEVLVAEDNPVNRLLVETFLKQFGLRVRMAFDGQQALDMLTQGATPALVLMDLQMPVMDGYTATSHIRAWETAQGRTRLPILALTADAFEEDRQHCLAVGMDGFLTKPIGKQALLEVLQTWLPGLCQAAPPNGEPSCFASLDAATYTTLRTKLIGLLQHHQFDALGCFDQLATRLQGTALASRASTLRPLIHALEFDQALSQLQQWPDALI